ncbi:MAG: DUF5049 domain-containing protein [Cellulosilyticum sp.]|nr:DUF5049 domain-containing protein [Cellulosilyticum sp.]
MTDKLYEQILAIRDLGQYNMLNVAAIQKEAYQRKYFELVNLIEEDLKVYMSFILYGIR